jgi:hypothetical protein
MKKRKEFMMRAIFGGTFFGLGNFLLDYISPYYSRTWEEYLFISLVFGLGFALLYPRIYRKKNETSLGKEGAKLDGSCKNETPVL